MGNSGNDFQYVRAQKGHSLLLWLFLSLVTSGVGLIWVLYYTFSPNHYWHL